MKILTNHILEFAVSGLLFFLSHYSFAQKDKVIQVNAESMKNLIRNEQQVVRYLDNVNISHQGTTMTCDSAYLIRKTNNLEAYGNVIVTKEDAKLYGDYLYYDGNTSMGKVTGKEVKLIQKDAKLVTDIIYFNTKDNSAYYNTSGILTNEENKLVSQRGYYYSKIKKYYFSGNVKLEGKDGRLYTDSLEYTTQDELAYFYGPTRIYNKDNYVYCEKGWYDRKNDKSNFFNNAFIINGVQKLYGQDIFYDKRNGYSKIIGKVAIVDTIQKTTVYGGRAFFNDKTKEAEVTEDPLLIMISDADTLFLRTNKFLVNSFQDTTLPDSTYRVIKALGAVKFYKEDIQGLCDSLLYNTKDSTISMFVSPVLWNEKNQISADFIKAFSTIGNKIKKMNFDGAAFFTQMEERTQFNQIKGKTMIAHFNDGKIAKLDVNGNAEAVRFFRDEGTVAAVNKSESSDLVVLLKNNQISKISLKIKPLSVFYPIGKVNYEEITLKGFHWLDDVRPQNKFDVIPNGVDLILTDSKPGFKKDIVQ